MQTQERPRMIDYLIGHRKIKGQFFSQLNILIDWKRIEVQVSRYYQRGTSVSDCPSYSGLAQDVSFEDLVGTE